MSDSSTRRAHLRPTQVLMIVIAVTTLVTAIWVALPKGPDDIASAGAPTPDEARDTGSDEAGAVPVGDESDALPPWRRAGWINLENAKPGTQGWQLPDDRAMWDKVRGFASASSVNTGEPFSLFVSTAAPTWAVRAFRMGYYGGVGAREVWRSPDQRGVVQPPAAIDRATGMREAPWAPSLEVTTQDWPPGMYLLKLESADGGSTFVPLVVRDDDSRAALVIQSSVTTWQAYNDWGGANQYTGPKGGPDRSRVVSFDRPYNGNGSGEFFGREFEVVWFVEQQGLDVTYWTDIDLNDRPQRLLQHKALVSLGHDEYYTPIMAAALTAARDEGVNLVFLGANAIYRKIRLEPSPLGPSRRQVNYRSAAEDPATKANPADATVEWRAPPINRPESAIVGNYYECNPVKADLVITEPDAWVFAGTGVRTGDRWPDAVGNEYDRVTAGVPTPDTIEILSESPVTCKGKRSVAHMTWYTAPSGAGVFAAGTFWLIPPLDDLCPNLPEGGPSCQIQKMVRNILLAVSKGPAGLDHPATNNTKDYGITITPLRWPTAPGPPESIVPDPTAPTTLPVDDGR
jgi:hypothetical protein